MPFHCIFLVLYCLLHGDLSVIVYSADTIWGVQSFSCLYDYIVIVSFHNLHHLHLTCWLLLAPLLSIAWNYLTGLIDAFELVGFQCEYCGVSNPASSDLTVFGCLPNICGYIGSRWRRHRYYHWPEALASHRLNKWSTGVQCTT